MTPIYSRDDERNIRVQRLVHDWHKSGLITDEQRGRMLPELAVDLRRTNTFLRITLFVFGCVIISAAYGLIAVTLRFDGWAVTASCLITSVLLFLAAQRVVTEYRLYHFGVEEAFAACAGAFLAAGAATFFDNRFETMYAFAAAAIGAAIVFRRFGYVYAAVASMFFATCFVFDIQQSDTFRRLFSFILLLTVFFFARERRQDHDWDHPADSYAIVEAAAWALLYFIANLKISPWLSQPDEVKQFYWATYGLTWLLPAAGLWFAIHDRHRWMLDVNIIALIVTMMTNKSYLGIAQKPWDPIVFGVMLIAVSLGLRRWLASGARGSRDGFVPHRLLESEKAKLSMAASASVLAPGAPPPSSRAAEPPPPTFGGGRSGGAGASGTF